MSTFGSEQGISDGTLGEEEAKKGQERSSGVAGTRNLVAVSKMNTMPVTSKRRDYVGFTSRET